MSNKLLLVKKPISVVYRYQQIIKVNSEILLICKKACTLWQAACINYLQVSIFFLLYLQ